MKSEVDQFGRSTTSSDGLSDEKSKRILDALSDIKNQLQNDEFTPKDIKENISRPQETKKETKNHLDFKNLDIKIEILEKKINQIVENLQNNQKSIFVSDEEINEEDLLKKIYKDEKIVKYLDNLKIKKTIYIKNKLINLII